MQTCDRLAPDTKILDMHMTDRELVPMDIDKVYDEKQQHGIGLYIPRTNETVAGLPGNARSQPYSVEKCNKTYILGMPLLGR